ncbi:hypothetical protein BVRB_034260 [Beta vulgaris subsp. vulgaris]|uniref:Mon2/Sec7/BIG1-like dimerisation and cyclophilin-binding domain-containing protein n=1 Tax=Beta vulgaris subsp. vulgaris TaxID=3555 RepID=A0A0J7YR67_BETVV|nr:hypothetical protein BVRB_034260 [Beta vulgaris subsp. vulgaris]
MACATKHPPLVIMSLNAMQRLSSCGALSASSVAMLIGTLRILSESTQSDILLRILQTLSLLANPATFEAGEETIPQALGN